MRHWWFGLGLLASLGAHAADDNALLSGFEAEFRTQVEEAGIPGAAYAIVTGDMVRAVKTYGVREMGTEDAVNSVTVFRLASVSKTFAADLSAMLMAEGKFTLDDPITKYVPALKFATKGFEKGVKVRHILSHSAGLVPNSYDLMLEDSWPMDKIVPRFDKLKPMCKPGECYGYQNVFFSLIEPVIEQTTGQGYAALLQARIFDPLDMKHASVGYDAFMAAENRTVPHILTRKGLIKAKPSETYYSATPAAGVNASIADMAKWLVAQMGHTPAVLTPAVLEVVTTPEIHTRREMRKRAWRGHLTDASYGLGWRLYAFKGGDVVMHGGAVAGYRSLIAYSRDKDIGIVMLMNADTIIIDKLAAGFFGQVLSPLPEVIQSR